jgi:NAD(P)-dependent dehydrogenase (short-subunit alcohol dehydrogenase family)
MPPLLNRLPALASRPRSFVERDIPLRRLGRANEVADLLLFLCSNAASYISGST